MTHATEQANRLGLRIETEADAVTDLPPGRRRWWLEGRPSGTNHHREKRRMTGWLAPCGHRLVDDGHHKADVLAPSHEAEACKDALQDFYRTWEGGGA